MPCCNRIADIFMDLSSIGDQDRMLHWVKINRPPDQLGFNGFAPTYERKSDGHNGKADAQTATAHAAAQHAPAAETAAAAASAAPQRPAPKKIPGMPVFRSS